MKALSVFVEHWRGILTGFVVAALVWRIIAIDADRDAQRMRADAADALLSTSIDAVGAANGWPTTRRLKREQLPVQIQLYGNALRDIGRKTAEAKAADLTRARDIEARNLTIMKELQDALSAKLAAELRRADDYARRLRQQAGATRADPGRGGTADLSAPADTAGAPDRAGEAAIVDDVRICTENTVKAEGWAEFWARVFADPR